MSGPEPSPDPFGKLTSEANHRRVALERPEIDYERCAICGAKAYVAHEGQALCPDCHRELTGGQQGQPRTSGGGIAAGDGLFVGDDDPAEPSDSRGCAQRLRPTTARNSPTSTSPCATRSRGY